jgi:hypothetical protein
MRYRAMSPVVVPIVNVADHQQEPAGWGSVRSHSEELPPASFPQSGQRADSSRGADGPQMLRSRRQRKRWYERRQDP